jgi:hypothetical protein
MNREAHLNVRFQYLDAEEEQLVLQPCYLESSQRAGIESRTQIDAAHLGAHGGR